MGSVQQRLKNYGNSCPSNGVAVFCGLAALPQEGGGRSNERLLVVDLAEPLVQPIPSLIYKCDNRFHCHYLDGLLFDGDGADYGFVVIDGHGTLFGHVKGKHRKVIRQISVDLPNKHRRGGQSANRFARLRDQSRQAYVRKVAEICTALFVSKTNCLPNVKGLVLAGCADFKNDLIKSKVLDKRLGKIIVGSIDLACGGRRGFDEAINRSAEDLGNLEMMQENKILAKFLDQVVHDSDLCCYGANETIAALEMGAVEDLIVWEDLDYCLLARRDPASGNETISVEVTDATLGGDGSGERSGTTEFASQREEPFVEWICEHYKDFGCHLHLVSGCSALGTQFVRGFGGVGGILRFRMPVPATDNHLLDGEKDEKEEENSSGSDKSCPYDFEEGDFGF